MRLPKQAQWAHGQYHRHGQEHHDQGGLRKQRRAKSVNQPDQQRRDKRATNTAKATGDHHHKSLDHHIHIHLQGGGLTR